MPTLPTYTSTIQPIDDRDPSVGVHIADMLCEIASIEDYRSGIPADLIIEATRRIKMLPRRPLDQISDNAGLIAQVINEKFNVNSAALANFYEFAAHQKVTFNYHQKLLIERAFNERSLGLLTEVLRDKTVAQQIALQLQSQYAPASIADSLKVLQNELKSPTLTRKDSKPRNRSGEILTSVYSALVYRLFPEPYWHSANDPLQSGQHYEPNFWRHYMPISHGSFRAIERSRFAK